MVGVVGFVCVFSLLFGVVATTDNHLKTLLKTVTDASSESCASSHPLLSTSCSSHRLVLSLTPTLPLIHPHLLPPTFFPPCSPQEMSSSDLNTSGETDPPVWEEHAKECNGCLRSFTMTRRKHHCRACGRTFCQTCSHHKDVLPEQYGLEGPQRTCDSCHLALQQVSVSECVSEGGREGVLHVVRSCTCE